MSTRLLYGEEHRLLPWAAEKIGLSRFRDDAKSIGIERDGEIAAVAVYDTFSEVECSVHLASDGSRRWMTREFLVAGFAYPFIQCGFQSMTGLVPSDNEAALQFDLHIGWTYVGTRRSAMPGGRDLIILEMLRDDCKWLPKEYHQ